MSTSGRNNQIDSFNNRSIIVTGKLALELILIIPVKLLIMNRLYYPLRFLDKYRFGICRICSLSKLLTYQVYDCFLP